MNYMDKIFVVGHKSPDLDSVAGAIAYAAYKNKTENTDKYIPATAGALNKETQYALEKFQFEAPEVLENASGKNLILVDHNEETQTVEGGDSAVIYEILDHHKINFSYPDPIKINIEAWGASCTIIANLFFANKKIEFDKNLAGLMLSAILIDTVISKSPTCTEVDVETMDRLAEMAEIEDWKAYGMELFKVRSDMSDMSDEAVIKSDYKDFDMGGKKLGIGQVETADLAEFEARSLSLLSEIEKIKAAGSYFAVVLFITDIINEGSLFLVKTDDQAGFVQAFGKELVDDRVFVEGIISRKKQVAPKLNEIYN